VPLSDERRGELPVDSSATERMAAAEKRRVPSGSKFDPHSQAAAPDSPNSDADAATDPEMTEQELFDLVSFAMLLGAPQFEELNAQTERGRRLFHQAGCAKCHVPRLEGPRGPIPLYSDLLLHDMGPDLADGIRQLDALGSEFRTQPLWGLAATAPYLHDGRAGSIEEAILAHGGEAQAARDAFAAYTDEQTTDLVEFLLSLGGREQASPGLLPPDDEVPAVGRYGGTFRAVTDDEMARFVRGRALYDRDFSFAEGTGGMTGGSDNGRFNGDSCRACHFDPVLGGAGPRDVMVMRSGTQNADGTFAPPPTTPNTILHKEVRVGNLPNTPTAGINVFEMRQTPHNFGLGLVEAVSAATLRALEDPDDADGDGISGRVHELGDGRVGRLGWKAQVPDLAEFVRDAMAAEIGLTVESQPGLTFGITEDDDGVPDPELFADEAEDLAFFLSLLAPPPRQPAEDEAQVERGESLFTEVGCARCHIPALPTTLGIPASLYSDLLLHDVLAPDTPGIEDGLAGQTEFRTAPLWGLSQTAPYFHDGSADTIDEAIRLHRGEAEAIRDAYVELSEEERAALLAFLRTL